MHRAPASTSDRIIHLLSIAETSESDEAIAAFLLAKRLMQKHGLSFETQLRPADEWPHLADEITYERLSKVLSLTGSDKEGECIAAFLMAVRLMKRTGIGFADIMKPGSEMGDDMHNDADLRLYRSIEIEMMSLKNRLTRLQGKLASQDGELKRYRAAFNELMEASWSLHGRNADPDGQPVYN
ncbi:MAG: DUF2786 domain-containing protein [Rhodospirillales bacterium]|nr:DUF2786 domain-containing protein [Rhodospirillales bacterium]